MEIRKVGVVGAGQMGVGIAQVFAQSGFEVTLNDVDAGRLDQARDAIGNALDRLVEKDRITREDREAASIGRPSWRGPASAT